MSAPGKSAIPTPDSKAERAAPPGDRAAMQSVASGTSMADPTERLQGKAGNRAVSTLIAHKPLPGSGSRLPRRLRAQLETQFGEDFSSVRVHDGHRAAEAAAALHAKAYTVGEDIVFAHRRYVPESFEGRRLLAHELAHVVQQRRGGIAPPLRRATPVEQAAEAAARSAVAGAAKVLVEGASGVGLAREGEDEIQRAFSSWSTLDQETEEEARRKPQPSPKREAARETTTPAADAPPKTDKIDPVLRDKSRELRDLRNRALKRMNRARQRGEDPSAYDARPQTRDATKHYAAVRKAIREGDEARYAAQRHAELVRAQPKMTHEDLFNKTLGMRGFEAAPGVGQLKDVQRDYKRLKRDILEHPDRPLIDTLHQNNKDLQREMAKLDREARKQGKLSAEDKARRDQLEQRFQANKETIKASPVTALRARAQATHDKLAISSFNDPDSPRKASRGGPAGRGENTYAVLQVVGTDGKILAVAPGKNNAQGHAEQNAIVQLERQIKGMKGGLPAGAHVEVVGDQVVCTSICKKDLAAFAARHNIERVDGYTFHAVPAGAAADSEDARSAKTTARNATTAAAEGRRLEKKHEPIYQRGIGQLGGGELTEGEKHRHAHKAKSAKTAKTAPTPKTRAKGPAPAAKKTRSQQPKPTGKAASSKPDIARKPAAPPPQRKQAAPKPSAAVGGTALAPSPAAKRKAAPQTAQQAPATPKPVPKPGQPATASPATQPSNSPTQSPRRSTQSTRGGGAFLAPGTAGASVNLGIEKSQNRGNGVTTGQSASFDNAVTVDVSEIPDSQPRKYRVTLRIDLSGQLGLSAGRENEAENARAGGFLSASGRVSGAFSHELSADEAEKYRLAAASGGGGAHQELEIVRLLAAHKADAARNLLDQINAAKGSAEAAKHLAKGDATQVSAQGSIGGGVTGSAGKSGGTGAGIELGIFRSGKVERTVEERDGKIVVTMTISTEQGGTLGGTGSEGVGSFGISGTRADSKLRSVSFTLDPNDKDFDSHFNTITASTSIEQLDALRVGRKDLVGATVTGKGTSRGSAVTAGILGIGARFNDGGSFNEQDVVDERGLSHRYEGSGSGGLDVTVGGKPAATTKTTTTFVANVGPDNTASGETSSQRAESDLGRSVDRLEKSFAKNPLTTTTGILTGKTKVLQERVDTSGAALTDDSFGRLASLAETPSAWEHAWNADVGAFIDWQKTRHKVLAAHGNRDGIARAVAEFESQGSGRSSTVERALGQTGIAFEFPDEIADQKPVYDSLIVGDPLGHARELAQRGQQEAALNELRTANDKLGKLRSAAQTHSGAFESEAKLAEMLNRLDDRRSQLRAEIRQLTPAVKQQGPAADTSPTLIGPPPPPAVDAEAEQRRKNEELDIRQQELTQNCMTLRGKEQGVFSHIRSEMDTWHFDHLSASINMAKDLKRVKDSYQEWDNTVTKLKKVLADRGEDPAKADAIGPDHQQWDAVNAQWRTW
jgi:hypothetical protein